MLSLGKPGDRPLDEYFRFGPRHEHAGRHLEGERHEFALTGEIGDRNAARPLVEETVVGSARRLVNVLGEKAE